jgi:uncharacterized protein with HEPN domain
MSHSPKDFLGHILMETAFILEVLPGLGKEAFIDDGTLTRAVIRSLEIIGEATKNLPDDFKGRYVHIPWRRMAGMRDRLIHGYFGVDYDVVWDVITQEVPRLHEDLTEIERLA